MFNMKYGPNAGLLSRPMAAALQQAPQAPQVQEGKTPARRPRGLFGRAGDWLSQTGDDGISRADRIGTIGALLRDNPAVGQNALAMQQDRIVQQQALAREQQERQGAQNTAQKSQLHEREQLNALADSYGLQGAERARFLLSPPDVREEYLNRQMNPEQPDMPSSYEEFQLAQQNPAYAQHLQANPRGNRVDVRVGEEGERFGTIPPGYMMTEREGGWQMVPVPGSPAEQERQQAERQEGLARQQAERTSGIATDEIGRALDLLSENPNAAGRTAALRGLDPESPTSRLRNLYDTLGAYTAFDRLQQMRAASPTGGALGNVSERELALLQSAYGSVDVSAPLEDQVYNLVRLNNMILDTVHGPEGGPPRMSLRDALNRESQGVPPGVDPELYAHMTPEERALWQQ